MALRRSIGLAGLTFIGIGGVLGSGWLFAPMLAAQHAGPAALVAWLIGLLAVMLVALSFAEIAGALPEAGAIARLPHYSHGAMVSAVIGWSAWFGYMTIAPIETIAILKYVAPAMPELLLPDGSGELSRLGQFVAIAVLAVMIVINALGVAWLDKANSLVTILKIAIPVIIGLTLLATVLEPANFTARGGFAPFGTAGILSAVAAGGVVFSYIGFRHVIDLAGEAENAQRNVPLSLILSVLVCFAVYALLQAAFIGGLPSDALAGGWRGLAFGHDLGPIAGVAMLTGLGWLISLLYAGAVVGPFGAALIATGSNARLGYALSLNGFFPRPFNKLSKRDVPFNALILGFVAGAVIVLTLPFTELVALNSATVVLSFCIGPVSILALRRQLPDRPRPFRLPFAGALAPAGFIIAALIIYWCGFATIWRLDLVVAVGIALFLLKLALDREKAALDLGGSRWLFLLLIGLTFLSWAGSFGGRGYLAFGPDMLAVAAWAIICFRVGLKDALTPERTREYVEVALEGP